MVGRGRGKVEKHQKNLRVAFLVRRVPFCDVGVRRGKKNKKLSTLKDINSSTHRRGKEGERGNKGNEGLMWGGEKRQTDPRGE